MTCLFTPSHKYVFLLTNVHTEILRDASIQITRITKPLFCIERRYI